MPALDDHLFMHAYGCRSIEYIFLGMIKHGTECVVLLCYTLHTKDAGGRRRTCQPARPACENLQHALLQSCRLGRSPHQRRLPSIWCAKVSTGAVLPVVQNCSWQRLPDTCNKILMFLFAVDVVCVSLAEVKMYSSHHVLDY
jgi:hypothetical protein